MSETMSISASACAIFCSDEIWGFAPNRKDIFERFRLLLRVYAGACARLMCRMETGVTRVLLLRMVLGVGGFFSGLVAVVLVSLPG